MKKALSKLATVALALVSNKVVLGLGLTGLAIVAGAEVANTDMDACTNVLAEIIHAVWA